MAAKHSTILRVHVSTTAFYYTSNYVGYMFRLLNGYTVTSLANITSQPMGELDDNGNYFLTGKRQYTTLKRILNVFFTT